MLSLCLMIVNQQLKNSQ